MSRYGWFSTAEAGSEGVEVSHTTLCPDDCLHSEDTENGNIITHFPYHRF